MNIVFCFCANVTKYLLKEDSFGGNIVYWLLDVVINGYVIKLFSSLPSRDDNWLFIYFFKKLQNDLWHAKVNV